MQPKESVSLGPDRPLIKRVVYGIQLFDNNLFGKVRYDNMVYHVMQHPITHTWYVDRDVQRVVRSRF